MFLQIKEIKLVRKINKLEKPGVRPVWTVVNTSKQIKSENKADFGLMFVCVFVCQVCIKVLGEQKTIENVIYLYICGVYQESKQF